MAKAKKVGRPRLAKRNAKATIVPVRFDEDDLRLLTTAAEGKSLSEWVRHTLRIAAEESLFGNTLHDAMKAVLLNKPNRRASITDIADEIERLGLYRRKDGNPVPKHQIYSRARKYPALFSQPDPRTVELRAGCAESGN